MTIGYSVKFLLRIFFSNIGLETVHATFTIFQLTEVDQLMLVPQLVAIFSLP